jgi:hypothetical protein
MKYEGGQRHRHYLKCSWPELCCFIMGWILLVMKQRYQPTYILPALLISCNCAVEYSAFESCELTGSHKLWLANYVEQIEYWVCKIQQVRLLCVRAWVSVWVCECIWVKAWVYECVSARAWQCVWVHVSECVSACAWLCERERECTELNKPISLLLCGEYIIKVN